MVDPVPEEVLTTHGDITLAIDLMFINKVAFLITVSRGLCIGTIHALDNQQISTVHDSLMFVINRYKHRGFHISVIMADEEFGPLIPLMPTYNFNLCGVDKHVPDIEHYIRTTKDSIWSTYNGLTISACPMHVPHLTR